MSLPVPGTPAGGPTSWLYATRGGRRLLFAALYFSEGAPIGFLWWALPTRLRLAGVPIEDITLLTSLLTIPWTFKFLWAPLVDACRSRRWTRRSWVIASQIAMGASLVPLAGLDLGAAFDAVLWLLLAHAVAAATQDVAIDALAVASVPAAERGDVNGWMQAGMLAGRSLLGGGALVVAALVGDTALIATLTATVWISLGLLVWAGPEPGPHGVSAPREAVRQLGSHLARALRRPATWAGLAFAALAGAGFEAVGALAGPFLVDSGASQTDVGVFFSVVSAPAMIVGALCGGRLADLLGRRRAVALLLVFLAAAIGVLVMASRFASDFLLPALAGVYVGIGLFTASSYALFMDLTDPLVGATQFSAYMAMTNACEGWATFVAGRLVPVLGYSSTFLLMAGISLFALPLLLLATGAGTPDGALPISSTYDIATPGSKEEPDRDRLNSQETNP